MLNGLKKALRSKDEGNFEADTILENAFSVKDVFLDDPETDIDGAEDDPEIRSLIEKIPGFDDMTDTAEDVKALTEGLAETILESD